MSAVPRAGWEEPTPLALALAERIARGGPVTFRDFMQAALYDPAHGYYTTQRPWRRGAGDFVTAPRFGNALARALADLAVRARGALPREGGGSGPFEVVEVGAGSGLLAGQLAPLLATQGMRLRVVEHARPPQLPEGVPWHRGLAELPGPVRGMVVSNELFDALPVHVVVGMEEGPHELWVHTAEGGGAPGRLTARPGPLSSPAVAAYLARFAMHPAPGEVVEVGLDAMDVLHRLAGAMEAGLVVTIDYGDTASGLRARGEGTLAAFRDHRVAADPLEAPGWSDLTAHVNLTALREEGAARGLDVVAEVPQWQLLGATGAAEAVAAGLSAGAAVGDPGALADALAAKALLAPGRLGDFRVLVQAKGLGPAALQSLGAWLTDPWTGVPAGDASAKG